MRANMTPAQWDAYRAKELKKFGPVFARLGLSLDEAQLHTGGERYLMSGKKLVLTGVFDQDATRVVIKVSSDRAGRAEIRHEYEVFQLLQNISFSHDVLLSPDSIHFENKRGMTVLVTRFIDQPSVFVARPLNEQFFLSLRALESQEGFHATTYGHERHIKNVFPILRARGYLKLFDTFSKEVRKSLSKDSQTPAVIDQARAFLEEHEITIDRHAPYLAHTDLVPHNMRVSPKGIFMLDYAAFHFGNKYESWARFLNYMLLHNPELEQMLVAYVRENRGADEYLALRLMRAFKLGELLSYYARSLARTSGDLHTLTQTRVEFWTEVLASVLADTPFPLAKVEEYRHRRDELRSEEELARQREFAKA